jgi:hypothetical protein
MKTFLLNAVVLGAAMLFSAPAQSATFSLVGTELKLDGLLQATPTSPTSTFTATVSAIVSETEVEYPNVNDFGITDTSVPGFPTPVTTVPVAIDAGADFLTIDFGNTAPFNRFVPAFQNTYIFTFESGIAPLITSAVIDTGVTTLGLVPEDITFAGNQLFVNVEGLFFNTSTFARINLTASPGTTPVPLPAGGALMLAGLLGLAALKRVRNGNASC